MQIHASSRSALSPAAGRRQGGSIFLLTLVLAGILALLALSFNSSVASQMDMARENRVAMAAEFSAESALDYAIRQLYLDPMWTGTGPDGVDLGGGRRFVVQRFDAPDPLETTVADLAIEGQGEEAQYRLRSLLEVTPADPAARGALVSLGRKARIDQVEINGNVFLADLPGQVLFWVPSGAVPAGASVSVRSVKAVPAAALQNQGKGKATAQELIKHTSLNSGPGSFKDKLISKSDDEWQAIAYEITAAQAAKVAGAIPDPGQYIYSFQGQIDAGLVYRFQPLASRGELLRERPFYAPVWNLDDYLVPGPDRVIYTDVKKITNVSMEETAVFVLQPGKTLTLENVDLPGGIVIWAPAEELANRIDNKGDWEWRNRLILKGDVHVGEGAGGVHPNLGLLAPTTLVEIKEGDGGSEGGTGGGKGGGGDKGKKGDKGKNGDDGAGGGEGAGGGTTSGTGGEDGQPAAGTSGKGNGGTPVGEANVTICHRAEGDAAGTTMKVPASSLNAHLAHGDTLGPCAGTGAAGQGNGNAGNGNTGNGNTGDGSGGDGASGAGKGASAAVLHDRSTGFTGSRLPQVGLGARPTAFQAASPVTLRGLFLIGGLKTDEPGTVFRGQLIVVNEIKKLENALLVADTSVVNDPPPGVLLIDAVPQVWIQSVGEAFDPVGG